MTTPADTIAEVLKRAELYGVTYTSCLMGVASRHESEERKVALLAAVAAHVAELAKERPVLPDVTFVRAGIRLETSWDSRHTATATIRLAHQSARSAQDAANKLVDAMRLMGITVI